MVLFHPNFFYSILYFYFTSINYFSIYLVNRPPLPSTTIHHRYPPSSAADYCRLPPLSAAASCTVCHCPSPVVATSCHLPPLAAATIRHHLLLVAAVRHHRSPLTAHLPLSAATIRPLLSPPLSVTGSRHRLPLFTPYHHHHLSLLVATVCTAGHPHLPPSTTVRKIDFFNGVVKKRDIQNKKKNNFKTNF